jgi:nitrate reductase NapE component
LSAEVPSARYDSALRDFRTVLATTVGVYVLVGVAFVGSFSTLVLVPEWVQAAVCRGLFFCWPGLVLALVVSTAVTVGVVAALANRGYLRVPDAW